MLERTEYPELPQRENARVRTTSREVDLAWLAGIIDGEGALGVDLKIADNDKPYLMAKVRVYNTDVRMIQKIARVYVELGVVFFYNMNRKRSSQWKNQLGICVTSQGSCLKVLEAVAPHLSNKQEMAKVMADIIRYVKSCPKGGNSWSFDYVGSETFKRLLGEWNNQKALHIDPSTTIRRAGEVVSW